MRRLVRAAALPLATGAILFVFSERMFWSVWRPGDEAAAYAGGWLLYSFLGYVLLVQCRVFQIEGVAALFLAAACLGWLDEGVVTMTLFGGGDLPFPLTIAWTALAWHALISVLVGFYALRRCLQAPAIWPTLGLCTALGVFWGAWALGWQAEAPPVRASAEAFAAHVSAATLALVLAHLVLGPAGIAAFRPSRTGMFIMSAVIAAFAGLITIPAVGPFALVLVPLFGAAALALHRARGQSGGDGVLGGFGPIRRQNLAGFAGLPAAATAVYATVDGRALARVHLGVAVLTTALGFAALAAALAAPLVRPPQRLAVHRGAG